MVLYWVTLVTGLSMQVIGSAGELLILAPLPFLAVTAVCAGLRLSDFLLAKSVDAQMHGGAGSREAPLSRESLPPLPLYDELVDDPLVNAVLLTGPLACHPRDDGWSGVSYLKRNQPVRGSRPCPKHARPHPECTQCRFSDEP